MSETKDRAKLIDRVVKLRNLARGASNEHERRAAAKRALDLMQEHGITDAELEDLGKPEAFDKVVEALGTYASKHPDLVGSPFGVSKIIEDTLGHAKKSLSHGRKVVLLDQLSQGLKIAKMFVGDDSQTLNDVASIVDNIVKSCKS